MRNFRRRQLLTWAQQLKGVRVRVFAIFFCCFPHGGEMAVVSPALRSVSPGARVKGHASQLGKLPLENVPEMCHEPNHCKGK